MSVLICQQCGKEYPNRKPSGLLRLKTQKYCSHKCKGEAQTGSRNQNWKGGRTVPNDPNGSVTVRLNGRQYLEHILVAEKALGKPLPKGTEVHHIDENRHNNAGSNLVICQDRAYHKLLHRRMRRLRDCGSLDLKRCWKCKEVKSLNEYYRCSDSADGLSGRCKTCASAAKRKTVGIAMPNQ